MSSQSLIHGLVDTHAHLQDPDLAPRLSEVLSNARSAGVVQVVAVGITAADSREVVGMADANPGVFATVGVHPNQAAESDPGDWERVVELTRRPKVVALGETGLDRFRDHTPFDQQQHWFGLHLDLARKLDLPVVIHCRQSEHDIIEQLRAFGRPARGVLHSFTGSWDDAQAMLDLGLYLSFAGMVTFTNRKLDELRAVLERVPEDRLLVETDSPYLSPHPHRGSTNEPARVALTAAKVAEVRGTSLEVLAATTTANARRLFRLPETERL
ncbi:MAG: TatD family hydrolase [Isosphaeraceae bacterium]